MTNYGLCLNIGKYCLYVNKNMDIKVSQQGGTVTLTLEGRLDTIVAQQTAKDIEQLLDNCVNVEQVVCNAEKLKYISSSGLRILLGLTKRYPNLRVVDVQPELYEIFEMTGFTKIMTVERALRCMNVDGYEVIGKGGVGTVYRIDEDTIIKVFREGTTLEEVRKEIMMSKEAFVMGMPTAISFDVVSVGTQYGLVYELLHADTLSACIMREPEKIDSFARQYANLFRQLHKIEVPTNSGIPDALENEVQSVKMLSRYFDTTSIDLLLQIAHAIPVGNRLLHCDLQTKNAMVQGDELMLIDMGEVGYGHPMLDLGHAYSAMASLVGDYQAIIGLSEEYAHKVYFRMIDYYFEGEDREMIQHRLQQLEVVGRIRNFTWLTLSDSFPEALIRECQELFKEKILKHKDDLLSVCKTFGDWKV